MPPIIENYFFFAISITFQLILLWKIPNYVILRLLNLYYFCSLTVISTVSVREYLLYISIGKPYYFIVFPTQNPFFPRIPNLKPTFLELCYSFILILFHLGRMPFIFSHLNSFSVQTVIVVKNWFFIYILVNWCQIKQRAFMNFFNRFGKYFKFFFLFLLRPTTTF